MGLVELCCLDVQSVAADDCLLAMWWVPPMPEEALQVMRSWGFELKTMKGLCWHKRTKWGKSHFGMGNWTRANAESCLFAARGKPKRVGRGVRQFIDAPIGRHSEKPAEARERLVQLMGDVPRLEMFAREASPGWAVFGNEVEESIHIPMDYSGLPRRAA